MKTFKEIKTDVLAKAKEYNACSDQYKRALESEKESEFLKVIADNLHWLTELKIIKYSEFLETFGVELMGEAGLYNSGEENTGFSNTGHWNTGHWNAGDRNTGYRNTGDRNTGDRNTGYSNTGYRNTGHWNTGYRNTGDSNTGHRNTGHWNTGHWNTGDWNTGHWNAGDRNTGYSNTGDSNTGDRNTGHWNTGDWNTGHWNAGDRNTGYSNTGDRNTGAFCTGEKTIKIFNKDSDWTDEKFKKSKVYSLLCEVNTKLWVQKSIMNDEEKAAHPSYKTAEGYLKDIPYKEAFQNKWNNWSEENRNEFKSLPNFDAAIFEKITGVKI